MLPLSVIQPPTLTFVGFRHEHYLCRGSDPNTYLCRGSAPTLTFCPGFQLTLTFVGISPEHLPFVGDQPQHLPCRGSTPNTYCFVGSAPNAPFVGINPNAPLSGFPTSEPPLKLGHEPRCGTDRLRSQRVGTRGDNGDDSLIGVYALTFPSQALDGGNGGVADWCLCSRHIALGTDRGHGDGLLIVSTLWRFPRSPSPTLVFRAPRYASQR